MTGPPEPGHLLGHRFGVVVGHPDEHAQAGADGTDSLTLYRDLGFGYSLNQGAHVVREGSWSLGKTTIGQNQP